MLELSSKDFTEGWAQPTVHLTDLIRVTLPKNPTNEEGGWIVNAFPQEDVPVQMLHQRFEF